MKNDLSESSSEARDGYAAISNRLLCDPTISALELRLLALIGSFRKRGYRGSIEYLCKCTGKKEARTRRVLKKLEREGLLVIISRKGRTSIFCVFINEQKAVYRPDPAIYDSGRAKVLSKFSQKCQADPGTGVPGCPVLEYHTPGTGVPTNILREQHPCEHPQKVPSALLKTGNKNAYEEKGGLRPLILPLAEVFERKNRGPAEERGNTIPEPPPIPAFDPHSYQDEEWSPPPKPWSPPHKK